MKNTSPRFTRSILAVLLASVTLLSVPLSGYADGGVNLSSNTRLVDQPYDDSNTNETESGIFGTKIKTKTPDETDRYTDSDTGISFRIPDQWQCGIVSEPRDLFRLILLREETTDLSIIYGVGDLYDDQDVAAGLARSELNIDFLEYEKLVAMFKKNAGEEIECSREIIGGREYITFELKSYVEIAGMTLTSVITHYFTVENGYFINFQFTDSRESEYYPEFISLLESVEIE